MPWSVAWSGETAFALRPSRDFPGMTEVSQIDRPGVGEPNFASVHIDRHRRGMVDHLCHVCGKPTPADDRWIFAVAAGGMVTLHDGSIGYGCNVPPLHGACSRLAAVHCPHLAHLADKPVPYPSETGRLIHRTDVAPGLEALAATFEPGLEVVYSCYRLFGPDYTREVQRLRQDWEHATLAARRDASKV